MVCVWYIIRPQTFRKTGLDFTLRSYFKKTKNVIDNRLFETRHSGQSRFWSKVIRFTKRTTKIARKKWKWKRLVESNVLQYSNPLTYSIASIGVRVSILGRKKKIFLFQIQKLLFSWLHHIIYHMLNPRVEARSKDTTWDVSFWNVIESNLHLEMPSIVLYWADFGDLRSF